jgi:hypothetical protein
MEACDWLKNAGYSHYVATILTDDRKIDLDILISKIKKDNPELKEPDINAIQRFDSFCIYFSFFFQIKQLNSISDAWKFCAYPRLISTISTLKM